MEFAHSTSHLHSPYPPRPPTITGQIIIRSALTDRFQHFLDPCYRYSTPYTQPSHIDGTAFIDLSLLPTFHRGHCYTLTFLALFSNSLPPPSLSAKCHTWNIEQDHYRVHMCNGIAAR